MVDGRKEEGRQGTVCVGEGEGEGEGEDVPYNNFISCINIKLSLLYFRVIISISLTTIIRIFSLI